MPIRTAIVLFSCAPEDLGWEDSLPGLSSPMEEVRLLHSAIVADLAERFSEDSHYRVVIFETPDARVESSTPLPTKVELRVQAPGLLHRRVQEAAKDMMGSGQLSSLCIFLGRNPLYPVQLLARGIEFLVQEDDVLVMGEALQGGPHPSLMWLALKSYHPEVFEQNERWWQGGTPLLQAIADAQALVMTVRPVREISSRDDLGYLFHEIEREVLLKQWYPVRTYEALHRMRRKHLIPESTG
ncbi:MAG TPA: hypothetical protein DGH68_12580 [Bacteroidetes bacterium]|jgi:hypothetical protein|nr:hypothetical protein [Bacteroidota bacterium]